MRLRASSTLSLAVAVLIFALAVAGCGSGVPPAEPPEARLSSPTIAPPVAEEEPALEAEASVAPTSENLIETSLAALIPEAAEYLEGRDGRIGAAVAVPSQGIILAWNGHDAFHMASVAKIGIMLTLLDQMIQEGRQPTDQELDDLWTMITISDNDAASLLWERVGGGQAIDEYMRAIGMYESDPNKEFSWGDSLASPHDMAQLLAKLSLGEILDEPARSLAIGLLQAVDPSQTSGVTGAAPDERPEGTIIGVKDGWYPDEDGWRVNSAGLILPGNEKPAYAMAVMTDGQPSWEYGHRDH